MLTDSSDLDNEIIETGETLPPIGRTRFSPTGLSLDPGMTYEEWEGLGHFLKQAAESIHWWIGDWMHFGELQWGERYSQALEVTDYVYGTLANDKYVAERVAPERRREDLSFGHHYEVASLSPSEQADFLGRAAPVEPGGAPRLSTKALRDEVQNHKAMQDGPPVVCEEVLNELPTKLRCERPAGHAGNCQAIFIYMDEPYQITELVQWYRTRREA